MMIEILEKRCKNNLVGVKFSENPNHPLIYEKMLEDKRKYNLLGLKTVTNPCISYLFADNIERIIDLMFSARMGHIEAMIELYKSYRDGHYVPSNGYLLIRWFRIVTDSIEHNYYYEHNLGKITFNIGLIYFLGDGVPKNLGKAIWWFKRAADLKNAESMYILGEIYLHARNKPDGVWFIRDDEVFKNFHAAFYWFNRCFKVCSDEYSYEFLGELCGKLCGKLYLYGIGIENNKDAAFELFMESIHCLNYSQKMYKLGKKYIYGRKKDFDKGIYWLNRAADHLNDDAILELGKIYLYDIVSEVDIEKASWWFEKVTDLSKLKIDVINDLVYKYQYGKNVDKNSDMIIYWYEKLAEIGNVQAMYRLGKIYRYGQGIEKNLSEAVKWLDMAFNTLKNS